MQSFPHRVLKWWKWALSFRKHSWDFEDYPISVRRNGADDPAIAWVAQFIGWAGPVGIGPTPDAARDNIRKHFAELKTSRLNAGDPLPRPGTNEPIRFAASSRVTSDVRLLDEFIEEILGFPPGSPVFISDGSSLYDFGPDDEVERLRGRIRSVYGIETNDLEGAVIAEILERIRRVRHDG